MIGLLLDAVIWAAIAVWAFYLVSPWAGWLCAAAIVGMVVMMAVRRQIAARRIAERQREARLIRHADEEHRMVQEGRIAGIYGDYQPPPAIRGMGIWMTDKDE